MLLINKLTFYKYYISYFLFQVILKFLFQVMLFLMVLVNDYNPTSYPAKLKFCKKYILLMCVWDKYVPCVELL